MHRLLAIVLLASMPLQFSWAAVAPYCEHETQAGAGHIGHHEHEHHAGATVDAEPAADAAAKPDAPSDASGDKALGAVDPDCGHCHGHCNVMPTPAVGLPGTLATAAPCASVDGSSGAHAPARPERPQWLPLA